MIDDARLPQAEASFRLAGMPSFSFVFCARNYGVKAPPRRLHRDRMQEGFLVDRFLVIDLGTLRNPAMNHPVALLRPHHRREIATAFGYPTSGIGGTLDEAWVIDFELAVRMWLVCCDQRSLSDS